MSTTPPVDERSTKRGRPPLASRPLSSRCGPPSGPNLFDTFPGNVVAVTYNVQAVQTEGRGFMHVDGFFNAEGSASTLLWSQSGERVSNSGVAFLTSAFDELGFLGVYVGGSGGKTHVIIDITGFYVDART